MDRGLIGPRIQRGDESDILAGSAGVRKRLFGKRDNLFGRSVALAAKAEHKFGGDVFFGGRHMRCGSHAASAFHTKRRPGEMPRTGPDSTGSSPLHGSAAPDALSVRLNGRRRMIVIFIGALQVGQTGLRHPRVAIRAATGSTSDNSLHFGVTSDTRRLKQFPPPYLLETPVHDLALHILLFLFAAAFLAGFIDSIAGGGGMITIPAMLIAGIPPLETLGTNKLQSLFGSGSASIAYARHGHVNLREQLPMALMSAAGAVLGALLATVVPADVLEAVLPFLLIGIALYFGFKPNIGDLDKHRRLSVFLFTITFVPLIGLYDGVFGPGTGSFFMLGFVSLAGYGILKATAHTKFLNFGSNIGAFFVFLLSGVVLWKIGLTMGVGQFLGAQVGSRYAMAKGAKIIKPLLVVVSIALAIRLLADPEYPLRIWLRL